MFTIRLEQEPDVYEPYIFKCDDVYRQLEAYFYNNDDYIYITSLDNRKVCLNFYSSYIIQKMINPMDEFIVNCRLSYNNKVNILYMYLYDKQKKLDYVDKIITDKNIYYYSPNSEIIFNAVLKMYTIIPEFINFQYKAHWINDDNIDVVLTKFFDYSVLLLEDYRFKTLKVNSFNYDRLVKRAVFNGQKSILHYIQGSDFGDRNKLINLIKNDVIVVKFQYSTYQYADELKQFEEYIQSLHFQNLIYTNSYFSDYLTNSWLYDPIIWKYVMPYVHGRYE